MHHADGSRHDVLLRYPRHVAAFSDGGCAVVDGGNARVVVYGAQGVFERVIGACLCMLVLFVYVCMYTYIHAYIHTNAHTYIYTYIHTHIHTMHVYIHTVGTGSRGSGEGEFLSPEG